MNEIKQYWWVMFITIPLVAYVISLLIRRGGGQPTDPSFRMTVEDVFSILGRGTVVTGKIQRGMLSVGNQIHVTRQGYDRMTVVGGIEMASKEPVQASVGDDDDDAGGGVSVEQAQAGDSVGVLLRNVGKTDVQAGDVLTGSDDC